MNYNNIKNFHTVVELKSLVAAAKYLHISQPALSKSIKNLEEELCCQLFTHAKNKMQLNENGQKYYDFTKKYFSLHQKLVDELRTSNGINSSHLQISFGSAGNIIPLLTHDFKQLYPQSTFTLRTKVPNIIDTNSHFIFTATREGKSYYFKPIRVEDYLDQKEITAYTADGNEKIIKPVKEDLKQHRSYQFQDLTARGTVEFRSVCTQS